MRCVSRHFASNFCLLQVSLATLGSVQVSVKKLNNQNVTMQQLEHMRKDVEQYHKLSVRGN